MTSGCDRLQALSLLWETKSPRLRNDYSVSNAQMVKRGIAWSKKGSSGLEEVGVVGN